MFAQTPALPPALEKLATTPVLPSELPPASYALLRTNAAAVRLARTEAEADGE